MDRSGFQSSPAARGQILIRVSTPTKTTACHPHVLRKTWRLEAATTAAWEVVRGAAVFRREMRGDVGDRKMKKSEVAWDKSAATPPVALVG
jgi:hypothetical protein